VTSRQRIFTTSYQLAENIDRQLEGRQAAELSLAALKAKVGSGAEAVAHFGLLDARLDIPDSSAAAAGGGDANSSQHNDIAEVIRAATRWDRTPGRPWIAWQAGGGGPGHQQLLSPARLAFQLLLPGTVSLSWASLDLPGLQHNSSSLLGRAPYTWQPCTQNRLSLPAKLLNKKSLAERDSLRRSSILIFHLLIHKLNILYFRKQRRFC
jgi:hypothetical protein